MFQHLPEGMRKKMKNIRMVRILTEIWTRQLQSTSQKPICSLEFCLKMQVEHTFNVSHLYLHYEAILKAGHFHDSGSWDASFSPLRPGFNFRVSQVRFLVDKVQLQKILSKNFNFHLPTYNATSVPHPCITRPWYRWPMWDPNTKQLSLTPLLQFKKLQNC
jgi:hypothetical protein